MLQDHPDVRGIEWRYHYLDPSGTRFQLQVMYSMKTGDSRVRSIDVNSSTLPAHARRNLEGAATWARVQAPAGEAYMRNQEPPARVLDQFFVHVMGEASQGRGLKAEYCVWFAGNQKEQMVARSWGQADLPDEVWEAIRRLDFLAWKLVLEDLQGRFRVPSGAARAKMPRLVYVAYRHGSGERAARRLAEFLRGKDLTVPWFDRHELAAGDSMQPAMQVGIDTATMGVIVLTPDFLEGPTARWEHEQILKRVDADPNFKAAYFLVGAGYDELPRSNLLSVRVESADDPIFDREASTIHRGVWGLPQESPHSPP